jgi:hypothetical protein
MHILGQPPTKLATASLDLATLNRAGLRQLIRDPKIKGMAELAAFLDAEMALTYMTAAVANAMCACITTTGLFMSIHSATPGITGASELVPTTNYTPVSGGRPPIAWTSASSGAFTNSASGSPQTFAMVTTTAGGIPYFGIWTANSSGTWIIGGTTTGLSGSIPSTANVTFTTPSVQFTIAG